MLPIEGTFGYLAPEYFMHGIVDEKTDVFAFGVLLLEIVTGRMPVDSEKRNLVLWVSNSTRPIWFKIIFNNRNKMLNKCDYTEINTFHY